EDGIRDDLVTGVQTCALPILRVSEEIDALRTLGLDPYGFLVFSRVITLVLVLPLLTILADVISIAGGLLVAMLGLDITSNAYLKIGRASCRERGEIREIDELL